MVDAGWHSTQGKNGQSKKRIMKHQPVIDFVICTYNRESLLRMCLESLIPQLIDDRTTLTVVDNKSTDGTVALLSECKKQYPALNYVLETSIGLSRARNAGWRSSSAAWIYYLDDDCIAIPGLVALALELVQSRNDVAAIGGPIEAIYHDTPPAWFPKAFGSFAIETAIYKDLTNEYIRGGNMMIRRDALAAVGGFDDELGVKGDVLRYGEEIALQHRLREKGYRIGYDPRLVMKHFVRPDKMSLRWLLRSEYARRRDKMLIAPLGVGKTSLLLARTILTRIVYVPYFLGQALFDKQYHGKAALFDSLKPVAFRLGEWIGSIKRLRK
jgi:GT2 family glycosyltransferase